MDKLTLAHDWYIKHSEGHSRHMVYEVEQAWIYADMMQAEVDKRNNIVGRKEFTTSQLKDLGVLKRNSIDDATHESSCVLKQKGYLSSDNLEYFWSYRHNEWQLLDLHTSFWSLSMKQIEEEMKEYLEPMPNGDYRYHKDEGFCVGGDWIEIPDGAEIAIEPKIFKGIAFYRNDFRYYYSNSSLSWRCTQHNSESLAHWKSWRVRWKREKVK